MKLRWGSLTAALVVGATAIPVSAQATSVGAASTDMVCTQQPCAVGVLRAKIIVPPPPQPPVNPEPEDQATRYLGLFAHLDAEERMAQSAENAGDAATAAAWRADFARKSALTPAEAQKVKEIVAEFERERQAANENYRASFLAVRHANPGVRMSSANSPELAASQAELDAVFPRTIANLVVALGSRSFSRLDTYTRHMHDGAKILGTTPTRAASVQAAR